MEAVVDIWQTGKNTNYPESYPSCTPVWFGGVNATVGVMNNLSYGRNSKLIYSDFINNSIYSDNTYDLIEKNTYMSFRKIRKGVINKGDTNIGIINYNGEDIPSTYKSDASFTPNLVNSKACIGREWQWQNQNRPLYGVVKSIRIYNRALSAEEIKKNYQIDKLRFDIQM